MLCIFVKNELNVGFFLLVNCIYLLAEAEYFASEENDVHYNEEEKKNDKGKKRLLRSKVCEEHKGEAEYDSGEVLVNHVIGRRGLKITVDLTKKDRTCAGCTCKHTVHHKELFLLVVGEELLRNDSKICVGDNCAEHTKNDYDAPIALELVKSDCSNT